MIHVGELHHQRHRGQPAGKGGAMDAGAVQVEHDPERRAKAGARRHTEDVGRHDRVAKQVLIGRPSRTIRSALDFL